MFWMSLFLTVFFVLDLVRINQEKHKEEGNTEKRAVYLPDAEAYARAEERLNMTMYKPPRSRVSSQVRTYSQH